MKDLVKQRRYKIIADYPANELPIGSIIRFDVEAVLISFNGEPVTTTKMIAGMVSSYLYDHVIKIKDYPHLFKKLKWWEDRELQELPEYVTDLDYPLITLKVEKWHLDKFDTWAEFEEGKILQTSNAEFLSPSTKEEYDNQ